MLLVHRHIKTDTYTHGHHKAVLRQHAARTAGNSAAYLLPHLRKGQRLLDVGSGPGSITLGLADHVDTVVGLDCSAEVVAQARVASEGRPEVEFIEASAYELPFPDASFDVVHAHQLLQHLSDPVTALREMRRVVRIGGIVAARDAVYQTMRGAPVLPAIERWREVCMATCRQNSAEPDAGVYLKQWMDEAGLPNAAFTTSVVTYSDVDKDVKRAWGESWAERTLHSFGVQALEYGIVACREELEAIAAGWHAWVSDPNAVFFYVNGECIARRI